MILLVSKDLLLFVNLSPFMYILEGLRPTSTMIIVSHLKLAQNGCLHARRSCCVRSRAGDAAAVRASVVPGHTHRGTPCNCSSLETRPGPLSENARTRHVCVRRPSCCCECSLFIRERGPEGAGWLASRAGGRLRGAEHSRPLCRPHRPAECADAWPLLEVATENNLSGDLTELVRKLCFGCRICLLFHKPANASCSPPGHSI